jgi:leucokinin receptor
MNYTYSEEDELYGPSVEVIVLLSICYGAISVLSVAGNALVMWAVLGSRRMQRSATNWLLANLALADVVIGLFVVPFQFQAALLYAQLINHPHENYK